MFRSKFTRSIVIASLLILGAVGPANSADPGVDPAIVGLQVHFKKKLSATTAEIEIVGILRNMGDETFKSARGQQSVRLIEFVTGDVYAKGTTVLEREFFTLKAGEKITYSYATKWDTSMGLPRRDFTFMIHYDAKIVRIPSNDDANLSNNKKTLKYADINKIVTNALAR